MNIRQNVYIIDDDIEMRQSTVFLLGTAGFHPQAYDTGESFLGAVGSLSPGCVLVDIRMPSMDGEQLIAALGERIVNLPVIVMTGHGDVAMAVRTMKHGAIDFLQKPFERDALLASLETAFHRLANRNAGNKCRADARARLSGLSSREAGVLAKLAEGHSNKIVAWQLDLSVRTVEMYRANMMHRLGIKSLPEALQLLFLADVSPASLVAIHDAASDHALH